MECYTKCLFKTARTHFEQSKFPPSYVMLGFMYSSGGKIGPRDDKQMNYWFDEAKKHANFFHTPNQFNRNSNISFCFGKYFENIEKDISTAMQYFEQSAEQGNPISQANLGYCYQYGEGVSQIDLPRAFRYYQKSADQGFAIGQTNLGTCYRDGQGVEADERRAIELYKISAGQGYSNAQTHLGFCYQNGKGVERDQKKANEYYKLAADQGESFAKEIIEKRKATEKKSFKLFG